MKRYNKLYEAKFNLPSPKDVDKRYASFIKPMIASQVKTVKMYLSNPKKIMGKYFKGKYGCIIMPTLGLEGMYELTFRKDLMQYPAPSGKWMGYYEDNWLKDYGISRREWAELSTREQADLECKEQVDKYIPSQFKTNFIRFYFMKLHQEWWWSGGSKGSPSQEKIWANKMFKELVK